MGIFQKLTVGMDTEDIELKKKCQVLEVTYYTMSWKPTTYENVHTLGFVIVLCDHWQSLTFHGNPWYTLAILGIP